MDQSIHYDIKGSFTNPDLPIKKLIDLYELRYFRQIQPIQSDSENQIFDAMDIEVIAEKIFYEVSLVKELLKKKQILQLNEFPFLKQRVEYYFIKNPDLAKNNILIQFVENQNHFAVFALSLFNEVEYQEMLNKLFREFYFEYRFIGYLSKILYYEAIHFDKNTRIYHKKQPLLLDYPFDGASKSPLLEQMVAENNDVYGDNDEFITEHLSSERLFHSFKKLTKHQQNILYLAYVGELKDVEIAEILKVSQQAVSKTRKAALDRLKKELEVRK